MDNIKKGLSIFAFFFKIGCFTFGGGWAILAQMEQEFVNKRQIITKDELLEMVAVGKSAPGIMITNISLLFGYHVAGVFGGICAVIGITSPAIIILSIVTLFYNSFKDNYWVHAALTGIRAAVVPPSRWAKTRSRRRLRSPSALQHSACRCLSASAIFCWSWRASSEPSHGGLSRMSKKRKPQRAQTRSLQSRQQDIGKGRRIRQ